MGTSHPPDDHTSYDDDVAQLTRLLLSEDSFDTFLNELVHSASVATAHSCSITLRLRTSGPIHAEMQYTLKPGEENYDETLKHVGAMKPGESRSVPPFPDPPARKS